MKVIAKMTLYAHGSTKVEAEGGPIHMIAGDTIVFSAPTNIDVEVEHPELLREYPMPREPGLRARLRRFYWGARTAWRESGRVQPSPRM